MTIPLEYYPFIAIAALLLLYLAVKLAIHYYRRRRRSLSKIYGAGFYLSIKQPRANVRWSERA